MRQPLSRSWIEMDLAALRILVSKGEPVWRIARRLRRSSSAVRGKMLQLGLRVSSDAPTLQELRARLRQGVH